MAPEYVSSLNVVMMTSLPSPVLMEQTVNVGVGPTLVNWGLNGANYLTLVSLVGEMVS